MSKTVHALLHQASALSELLAQLQQVNLQLRIRHEVAWQVCGMSHAVLNSYVAYKRQNDTLASILATPDQHDTILSALEQQAQQLLQQLRQIKQAPCGDLTTAAPAAPAADPAADSVTTLATDGCAQTQAAAPFSWHTDPVQFMKGVLRVLDWSATSIARTECEDTFTDVYGSLEPLVRACQQAKDTPAAAAAEDGLRSYITHMVGFFLIAGLMHPDDVAIAMAPHGDVVRAEHLQHITRTAQLSAEQLQQVALLHGAFKQLSQPYTWLRQELQLLLASTEQSLTALVAGEGVPSLAAHAERLVRVLLPAIQHSSSGSAPRVLVTAAVQAISAAAVPSTRSSPLHCSLPATAAPGSDTPAAAAAHLSDGLCPDVPIHMTPELGEQLSRLLERVMRKLAWLEFCLGFLVASLLPLPQVASLLAASPPYIFNVVAWAAHVSEQVQQQQQQQQQQRKTQLSQQQQQQLQQHQQDCQDRGNLATGQPVSSGTAGRSAACRRTSSSSTEGLPPTSSSSVPSSGGPGPAGLQGGLDQLCQALREVFLNQGPAARARLREAAAAHSSRHAALPGLLQKQQQHHQQQMQQQGHGDQRAAAADMRAAPLVGASSDPLHMQQRQVAEQLGGSSGVCLGAAAVGDGLDLDDLLEQLVGEDGTNLTGMDPQAMGQLMNEASALLLQLQQQQPAEV